MNPCAHKKTYTKQFYSSQPQTRNNLGELGHSQRVDLKNPVSRNWFAMEVGLAGGAQAPHFQIWQDLLCGCSSAHAPKILAPGSPCAWSFRTSFAFIHWHLLVTTLSHSRYEFYLFLIAFLKEPELQNCYVEGMWFWSTQIQWYYYKTNKI